VNSIAFGLPLHPLVVHAVVVLLPLGALGLIAAVLSLRVRRPYGAVIMIVLTLAIVATVIAKFSGQQLAEVAEMPQQHSQLGDALLGVAIGLLLVTWAWWLLWRRRDRIGYVQPGQPERVLSILVVPFAVAALALTGLTGHAGASATWGEAAAAAAAPTTAVPAAPPQPQDAPPPMPSPEPPPTPVEAVYSMVEVAQHDSASQCWAVIDGGVYDLSEWINRHPGGRTRILNLCGTNASSQFRDQHSEDTLPNAQLAEFRIGRLI
jgi:uncharacterized membrane protein